MNRIEKIRNIFRLETLLGRVVFSALIYLLFWWIFYGIWFLLPYSTFDYLVVNFTQKAPYYLFGIVPLISLFIPYFLRKTCRINIIVLSLLHIVLLVGSAFLFFFFSILTIYKNYTIPGL